MSREYREEVIVYMTMMFYDEFLKNKFIVLDEYYNIIRDITDEYLAHYDNKNKALASSIEDYFREQRPILLDLVDNCTEDY